MPTLLVFGDLHVVTRAQTKRLAEEIETGELPDLIELVLLMQDICGLPPEAHRPRSKKLAQ